MIIWRSCSIIAGEDALMGTELEIVASPIVDVDGSPDMASREPPLPMFLPLDPWWSINLSSSEAFRWYGNQDMRTVNKVRAGSTQLLVPLPARNPGLDPSNKTDGGYHDSTTLGTGTRLSWL